MSVWAVVPVKPLLRAKSRLADILTPKQRSQLAEEMLRRTLGVVGNMPEVAGTLVISRDSHVLAISRDLGANTVQESGTPELNSALMRATQVLGGWRAGAVLVLPADIPLINMADLAAVITLGQRTRTVVLVPDSHEDGTNVLMARPPAVFSYAYGVESFPRHQELARLAQMDVKVYHSERLALDIDTPEDWGLYQSYVTAGQYEAEPLLMTDAGP
jgi:2-phospho-L-lactate/phosphoenolpyruvate guanylyltransferase